MMEEKDNKRISEQEQLAPIGDIGLDQQKEYTRPQEQVISPITVDASVSVDVPTQRPEDRKKQRRRRRNTVIVLVALAVFVFTGAVSGFVFLNKYFTDRLFDDSGQSSQPPTSTPSMPSVNKPGPGVENGPTVQLEDRPGSNVPMMSIPDIYQQVSPSVVMILAGSNSSMALGTGIIMSEDGFIITNAHIITASDDIQIVMCDNETIYNAEIMGSDTTTDIAVLKIDAHDLQPAAFGNSDQVVIGESVVTIGNPYSMSYAQTVTDGIISGIRRNVYDGSTKTNLLQTNAQLNPGNSGGPLINMYGQVIGINSAKIMSSGSATYEGLGFAIPMTDAKEIVDELIRFGYIAPDPVIGITVSYVSQESASAVSMVSGCMVMSVEPDSDAHKQGLRIGDIITQINGKTFNDLDGFIREKNRHQVGDWIDLTYWRMGEYYEIRVELIEAS
jgi:serine protease Do